MCQLKSEGGKRCASRVKGGAAKVRNAAITSLTTLRDDGYGALSKGDRDALVQFASLDGGPEQLDDLAGKYEQANRLEDAQAIRQAIKDGVNHKAACDAAAASMADSSEPATPAAPETGTAAAAPAVTPAAQAGTAGSGAVNLMDNDGPTLAVTGKYGQRVYVAHPDDIEYATTNTKAALAEGKAFPSITTALKSLDKPALMYWATGCSGDEAVRRMQILQDADPTAREQMLSDWLSPDEKGRPFIRGAVANAKDAKSKSAATRGTHVHALCEQIAHGQSPDIPDDLAGYVNAYQDFQTAFPGLTVIRTEATVGNFDTPYGGYMGTTDMIASIDGKNYVIDLKTNDKARIYDETGMQLAAAGHAPVIVNPDGTQEPMPKIDGALGVALGPDGKFTVRPFRLDDGNQYQGFLAALGAWRWKNVTGFTAASANTPEKLAKFFAA